MARYSIANTVLKEELKLRFIEAMSWTTNATEAMMHALPPREAATISRASAAMRAHKMTQDPAVRRAIIATRRETAERNKALADKVVMELTAIATSRISNVAELSRGKLTVRDFADIPPQEEAAIKSISSQSTKYGETVKVELWDKLKALDTLVDLFALNKKPEGQAPIMLTLSSAARDMLPGAIPPAEITAEDADEDDDTPIEYPAETI